MPDSAPIPPVTGGCAIDHCKLFEFGVIKGLATGRSGVGCQPSEASMPGHNVLDILRLELEFLELGLYRVQTPGRPLLIFEDSPACSRYGAASCPDCALMQFVPFECRSEPVPCHHIRLNNARETVHSLYRTGTQEELEEALRNWLRATISRLEEKQFQTEDVGNPELSPSKLAA